MASFSMLPKMKPYVVAAAACIKLKQPQEPRPFQLYSHIPPLSDILEILSLCCYWETIHDQAGQFPSIRASGCQ